MRIAARIGGPQSTAVLRYAVTAGALIALFSIYGIAQERIMTTDYAGDGRLFTDTAFIVLINRLVAIALSGFALVFVAKERLVPIAPPSAYIAVAGSNFAATVCQYEALKYVTFATQTLVKCAKVFPVLLYGYFLGRNHSIKEFLLAGCVFAGCVIFLMTGSIEAAVQSASNSASNAHLASSIDHRPSTRLIGLSLSLLFLFFDGTTSISQERLFRGHKMHTFHQLFFVSISSACLSLGTLTLNGGLFRAPLFVLERPLLLFDLLLLASASACGQMLIYFMIKTYGAVAYSNVMTTRQFVSLLISQWLFSHSFSAGQMVGCALVFSALFLQSLVRVRAVEREHTEELLPPSIQAKIAV